jgi:hypothetical protein
MDARNISGRGVRATLVVLFCGLAISVGAQEMQPRAYTPAPVGITLFGIGYSHSAGGLLFDPSLPVEDARVVANLGSISVAQTLGVMGRSAQLLAIVPYVQADLTGLLAGNPAYRFRSGLADSVFRYAMNIYGAPAMHPPEFVRRNLKTIVGASLTVSAPTGQYDPNLLINISANRWAFKPEVGGSRTFGKWVVEGAAGVWIFAANKNFYGGMTRTQNVMGSLQAHVVRVLPHRIWAAFDATYFTGGRSTVNGTEKSDLQANVRLGATVGMVVTPRQALRISFFDGVITRIGSDVTTVGITYTLILVKGR